MIRFTVPFFCLIVLVTGLVAVSDHQPQPARSTDNQIAFEPGTLYATGPSVIPAMTFGPDGRLYVAAGSDIVALTLDSSGQHVVAQETIANSDVNLVLGLAFDPTAPTSAMRLYVSRTDNSASNLFPGIISRFTSPEWQREDIITGLPEGHSYWHYTDGIAFDSSGKLYIGQGSTTEEGVGDDTPLGGAILVADVNDPSFDGHVVYEPPGVVDNHVDQVAGDVHVFAPGFRNPYGIIVHSNGYIYATDNAAGNSPAAISCTEVSTSERTSSLDEVDLIEQDHYYGLPNRNRGRFDPRQCVYHAPDKPSGADYTAAISTACHICESLAEYTGGAFNGAMKGDLVLTQLWNGGVWRVHLSSDGRTALSTTQLHSSSDALGIAVGAGGIIYFGGTNANHEGGIQFLRPIEGPETPSPSPTMAEPTPSPTPGATFTPTPTPHLFLSADADCNGVTNSLDAALILQLNSGLIESVPCPLPADANRDGRVDSIDALIALQCAARLLICG